MKTATYLPTAAELETAETHEIPDWIFAANARTEAREAL
jgi:hypothetical protein